MQKTRDRYLIRQNENGEALTVVPREQGRMIVFLTRIEEGSADSFNVSLSWSSLDKLHERMKKEVFNWEINDRSLSVKGEDGKISLRFMSTPGAALITETVLSHTEAELFKEAMSRV